MVDFDATGQTDTVTNTITLHTAKPDVDVDSNNDGLIEIPESSDWMDLFPRSYNVLYDEVLWYLIEDFNRLTGRA